MRHIYKKKDEMNILNKFIQLTSNGSFYSWPCRNAPYYATQSWIKNKKHWIHEASIRW